MGEPMKIVICDDEIDRAQDWAERVVAVVPGAQVQHLGGVPFAEAVRDLKLRMATSAEGATRGVDEATLIDTADILILDSDLTPDRDANIGDDPAGLVATHLASGLGAEIAHLARTYTTVGAIVIINQDTQVRTFDLTLTGRQTAIAEVYITDDELGEPGLWDPTASTHYRPWVWPALTRIPPLLDAAMARLRLSDCVSEALALGDCSAELLIGQIETLDLEDGDAVGAMTFEDVAKSSGYGLGLRPREDGRVGDAHRLRVALWGTRRWLERSVLPEQNILIDLPHLLQRNPWLVSDREDPASWDRLARNWDLKAQVVLPDAFNEPASELLGRPVWDVARLPTPGATDRVRASDPIFCEDTSTFISLGEATGFLSNLQGDQARRFVRRVPAVNYSPKARLML